MPDSCPQTAMESRSLEKLEQIRAFSQHCGFHQLYKETKQIVGVGGSRVRLRDVYIRRLSGLQHTLHLSISSPYNPSGTWSFLQLMKAIVLAESSNCFYFPKILYTL